MDDKSIKILQVFCEPLANGGQESFIMNMYRNIDRTKVQFDFFTPFCCDNMELKQEIERMGGEVFYKNRPFDDKKNKYVKIEIRDFLSKHQYNTIHIHSGSIYSLMIVAKIARKCGIKNIIVHSHCGGFKNFKYRVIKFISTPYFLRYPTKFCACSNLAAEWKFPKKIIQNNNYIVIKNAIDTNKFFYSEEIRKNKRKEMNLENKFVVGHIGRFSIQKNHEFLIDIFNEIQKMNNNAVLLLVGVGSLQKEIKDKIEQLGLINKVKFLNIRKDIPELLNVMDVFVLPSYFEGLPVVGVEAQATGLQVFTSTNVARELPIEEISYYYSLNNDAKFWATNIIKEYKKYKRQSTTYQIKESGYDIKDSVKALQSLYLSMN